MKRVIAVILLLTPLVAHAKDDQAKRELLAAEHRWLAVEWDPDALESILAPDFLHVLPSGIITKKEQLAFMRTHPRPKSSERYFEDLRVRVYGKVGIVNGIVVATEDGRTQKTAFTDVFARRHGKWLAVNAQESPLSNP